MKNHIENGKKLPFAAKMLAVNSYVRFLDKYPLIKDVEPAHWDFIITIAGIFTGVVALDRETISDQKRDMILDAVTSNGLEIYQRCVEAYEDCSKFVERTHNGLAGLKEYQENPNFLFADSLGSWIVWNLFGHAPENSDERQLVRVLGGLIAHSFATWWKDV